MKPGIHTKAGAGGPPTVDAGALDALKRRRTRVRLLALPCCLLFGGLVWLSHFPTRAMRTEPTADGSMYATYQRGAWIYHLGLLMSLLTLAQGRVPRWVDAQLSPSETERQQKLRDLKKDPWS